MEGVFRASGLGEKSNDHPAEAQDQRDHDPAEKRAMLPG
jgi:hypothetical protein